MVTRREMINHVNVDKPSFKCTIAHEITYIKVPKLEKLLVLKYV